MVMRNCHGWKQTKRIQQRWTDQCITLQVCSQASKRKQCVDVYGKYANGYPKNKDGMKRADRDTTLVFRYRETTVTTKIVCEQGLNGLWSGLSLGYHANRSEACGGCHQKDLQEKRCVIFASQNPSPGAP